MAQGSELVRAYRLRVPSRARTGLILVILALAVVSSILCTGYRDLKGANHPFQLIIIQKIHDPSLYATDAFVENTVFAYASLLWYGVAYLSDHLDLSMLLFSLFLINRVLYAVAFYLVGRVFFPNSLIAPVGALTFFALSPTSIIGSGHPIRDYAEQTARSRARCADARCFCAAEIPSGYLFTGSRNKSKLDVRSLRHLLSFRLTYLYRHAS